MQMIDELKDLAAQLIVFIAKDPIQSVQYFILILTPLLIVAGVFSWRLQKALQKKEREAKRKEKLLNKLHKSRNDAIAVAEKELKQD
ncbi:hypothetical protein PRIPAC_88225 [Pristionchus pacificus]|uniref:Small integral membrane protein 15 n=1 Tax=Pristionchus pacificus TaxID=54126 RepID=A0A2A6B850_PRIPA|nr:hypothetical protein PRIPAC_88225 [Pristionchus pacificus]|eukprot:PDM62037.1 hypothetical protein PRIPAC_51479 [Pristionchus pacificus]